MFRKIVVDYQRMPLGIAEVLAHRAGRIRSDVLHRRRLGSRGRHHDGVIHRAVIGKQLHHLCNRRTLLSDGAVDTNQIATLVVDDGVDRDSRLSRLAIANDQLALAAANRNHAVDGLQTRRHWFAHRLSLDDTGSESLQRNILCGRDGSFVVDWLAERVHYAADHGIANRHAHDAPRALYLVAFFDFGVVAQKHHADLVFFQVHGNARHITREREQLPGHDLLQAVHTSNAVAEGDDSTDLIDSNLGFVILDLLPD